MSQVRGSCGHLKASWDNHPRCFACSRCSFQSRCEICKLWPSSIWTLASNRRAYVQRNVAMDKKKKGKKGASSRDTVSNTVEGSNDNCQPGSGTVSRQSQFENSSQTKSDFFLWPRFFWIWLVTGSDITRPVTSTLVYGSVFTTPIPGPVISAPVTGPVITAPVNGSVISTPITGPVISRSSFFL